MGYYNTCYLCGSTLDPEERCDCEEKSEQLRMRWEIMTTQDEVGQLTLVGDENG